MNKFYYFAYGSNMLTARLHARCPSARLIGVAEAPNHSLTFSKRGADQSGKATLIAHETASQPGIVYEIDAIELAALDRVEGPGYERLDHFAVWLQSSKDSVLCKTYIARQHEPDLQPFDWYLALVIAGAKQHSLPENAIRHFKAHKNQPDPEAGRPGRIAALEALSSSGHTDLLELLRH